MKLGQFVDDLKLKTVGRLRAAKVSKTDFGVVKVAFMVAALDGEVSDAEGRAFDALLKKCRGYSAKAAAAALDEAMRSAGYLMLFAKRATDEQLVRAFMVEARAALPNGFAYLSVEEVRRAIVTWIAMGLSDGDYSARERLCIEALRKSFAEIKASLDAAEEDFWCNMSPAYRPIYGSDLHPSRVRLVSRDFVGRVEKLVAEYGDVDGAAKELAKLIAEDDAANV